MLGLPAVSLQPGAGRAARTLLLGVCRSVEQRPRGKTHVTASVFIPFSCLHSTCVGLFNWMTYYKHWISPLWGISVPGAMLGLFHPFSWIILTVNLWGTGAAVILEETAGAQGSEVLA